ncbi:SWPV2-ORF200 [Shearwaterpox virus]|uniref:SWPV2-ORF200 n=1 Tax=Shearwaterpox virus TaxID=1974596 RepID=A0A1V0QGF5_CNPV|nr:SWPV2-ORF200 [Shearwaterpox virus]QRM15488.1 N1R/p28-like protein [Mudlarkpox virus]QRM15844.1 n1r/p28-like protein [Penguinpox virus 2]QRM16179.1 n1r/p28-like protein [Albatrosspox virus]
MDFRCIISEHINDKFCYIEYGDMTLIMMKDNSFINASKLCDLNGKDFRKWLSLSTSKFLIDGIESICKDWKININKANGKIMEKSHDTKMYKEYDVSGSYIHYDLIPHVACWVFNSFALTFSAIINKYASNQYSLIVKSDNKFIDEITEFMISYNAASNTDTSHNIEKYINMLKEV